MQERLRQDRVKQLFLNWYLGLANQHLDQNFSQTNREYLGRIIKTEQRIADTNRRHLAGVVDPTKCTATGTGIITNISSQVCQPSARTLRSP